MCMFTWKKTKNFTWQEKIKVVKLKHKREAQNLYTQFIHIKSMYEEREKGDETMSDLTIYGGSLTSGQELTQELFNRFIAYLDTSDKTIST